MRNYRLAVGATGEMTSFYINQDGTLAQITSIMNAANLIYELEASIPYKIRRHFDYLGVCCTPVQNIRNYSLYFHKI